MAQALNDPIRPGREAFREDLIAILALFLCGGLLFGGFVVLVVRPWPLWPAAAIYAVIAGVVIVVVAAAIRLIHEGVGW